MKELAYHYHSMRKNYPNDKLLIMFDIDGTIIDMRYMILYVLQAYDRKHGTHYFTHLKHTDIRFHENKIDRLLSRLNIPLVERKKILEWYLQKRWTPNIILKAHRPYPNVLAVIRWFQIQPNTDVGLNTGRPKALFDATLQSLNELAEEYRVHFNPELLYMNQSDWEFNIPYSKAQGVKYFQDLGYRVFAAVDNEPANLKAIHKIDTTKEIMLLHADTLFESSRKIAPKTVISGKNYDITELIKEKELPPHIQFVWHGINDEANLRQFLASNIQWAEIDVRRDPFTEDIIVRHDDFYHTPLQDDEDILTLDEVVKTLLQHNRSIKFDLKDGKVLIKDILELVDQYTLDDHKIWFNSNVELLEEEGFKALAEKHPHAILQWPIDFLTPLIISVPKKAKEILDTFTAWGINRLSISWKTPYKAKVLSTLEHWGFEVNIYNVPNLEAFLQAVLLKPRSITSDFNFPKWHYYGRGSGQNKKKYLYQMKLSS